MPAADPRATGTRERRTVVGGDGFAGWHALNDTIMGGRSSGSCRVGPQGLVFDGDVVADGGGFISLRSPQLSPPLDLSGWGGLELELLGDGRTYKLAVGCADGVAGLTELIPGGLRWVQAFTTTAGDINQVRIRFEQLSPSLRARPVDGLPLGLPLRFNAARINRLQLLHSRFGDDGQPNPGFRAGPLHLELRAIHAVA
ncbi:MAG: CIA30 family protein [Prochlorococcaceae cyanobacterium]